MADVVSQSHLSGTPVYPIGGGTSLDYGLRPTKEGVGLAIGSLNRIVDYPSRDMTITAEAGMTMANLAAALASENQWLPCEVPQPDTATIGGVVATNSFGPRCYGYGTIRDYVIGIRAIDGRGMPFSGGGRVVKNVAGFDFCKLLTGSLGTLGVITEITLKLKPRPQESRLVIGSVKNWEEAELVLAALVHSQANPTAIEVLSGRAWNDVMDNTSQETIRIAVGCDGTEAEAKWSADALMGEISKAGARNVVPYDASAATELWSRFAEFPCQETAPLVLKISCPPDTIAPAIAPLLLQIDPQCSLLAHAGFGTIIARFSKFDVNQVSRDLVGRIQATVGRMGGRAIVLSSSLKGELTPQAVWGQRDESHELMRAVKARFDPQGILNPGRFLI